MKHSTLRREREQGRRERGFWPSYEDFKKFLEENPRRKFDMEDPHSCVAAEFANTEISEVYIGPAWFKEFQKKVNKGVWLGADLLRELKRIPPPRVEGKTIPRRWGDRAPK